ncbi:meckelin-like [Brachionus plicatilis]|uniref:Meckelin-like n=1 Tax=Brachionus plicatilis TaxID=10195 RepID=A0A3M7S027_BRAPC|nr:meckelin-like [Brachionus plicatilis]
MYKNYIANDTLNSIRKINFSVVKRNFIENIFDIEFKTRDANGYFYKDDMNCFTETVYFGKEKTLFIFEFLLFLLLDYFSQNFVLASLIVYIVSKVTSKIRSDLAGKSYIRIGWFVTKKNIQILPLSFTLIRSLDKTFFNLIKNCSRINLILIFCLIACSTCSPISSWSIRINESDGYQNCMAKTRTHIFFGTRICQAEFSCNPMNYGQHGIGFAISEKLAIEEAINDSRSRCN